MYPNPPDVEAEKNWAIEIAAKEERGEACEADYMSLTFDEITYRRFRLVFALRGHRVRCSRCADRKQASWHLDQDDHDIVCKNNMMSPDNPAKIKECGQRFPVLAFWGLMTRTADNIQAFNQRVSLGDANTVGARVCDGRSHKTRRQPLTSAKRAQEMKQLIQQLDLSSPEGVNKLKAIATEAVEALVCYTNHASEEKRAPPPDTFAAAAARGARKVTHASARTVTANRLEALEKVTLENDTEKRISAIGAVLRGRNPDDGKWIVPKVATPFRMIRAKAAIEEGPMKTKIDSATWVYVRGIPRGSYKAVRQAFKLAGFPTNQILNISFVDRHTSEFILRDASYKEQFLKLIKSWKFTEIPGVDVKNFTEEERNTKKMQIKNYIERAAKICAESRDLLTATVYQRKLDDPDIAEQITSRAREIAQGRTGRPAMGGRTEPQSHQ
ncbi:uncharacterized protein BJ171DRAFT_494602 [Polychytrium aggregatum]|uniref:uncharacterized protein n=1 Tax=Polychytrium aggregatum TaxID=110093 RepID=UPI0022FECDC0|nr:uncharacterized protein BJ171DRAFT_494602 [Polychytrium aggregatum]KAI9207374.1 hypothetical protein BJ171DRAFT_494602 [Polychytrium aggregatum]